MDGKMILVVDCLHKGINKYRYVSSILPNVVHTQGIEQIGKKGTKRRGKRKQKNIP
jgi:hypothetical protein